MPCWAVWSSRSATCWSTAVPAIASTSSASTCWCPTPLTALHKKGKQPMAELTINADEITAALKRHVDDYTPEVGTEQVGRIVEVGDGIARVTGLPGAAVNEILEFADGTEGLALNLDEETIGAVILGDDTGLEEEQLVKATGRILSVRVGDALLGRVVNG